MADPDYDRAKSRSRILAREMAQGLKVTYVGMVVNVLLVAIKLWVGIVSRSQALVADGVHSISDLVSDVVVIVGLRMGRKEEDSDHPWGHARIESIASMMVGFLLLIVAIGIAWSALTSVYLHEESHASLWTIFAALVSVLSKEALYWYTVFVGRRIKSPAVIGNAWHHRSDALSSVAVLFGVGAAYINPDWHIADPLAALVVTFFIFKVGYRLVRDTLRELVDTAPDAAIVAQLRENAANIDGVRKVGDVRARHSGAQIFVEIHIAVDPHITVEQGHAIAENVERSLLDDISDVTRVITHVDPDDK